ncbi:MAG: PEP-CTERM sorting domain-containing protein [Planctomycetota bacterium]
MKTLNLLAAGLAITVGASASAATILSISTVQGSLNSGSGVTDRFDPAAVTITNAPNTTAPTVADLTSPGADGNGIQNLGRFWNNPAGDYFSFDGEPGEGGHGSAPADFERSYFAFTVAADPGFTLDLDEITFRSAVFTANNRRGYELYAEVDGGTFDATDILLDVNDENAVRTGSFTPRAVDLTGAKFQGIESVTFRVYPLTDLAGRSVEIGDFVVTGDVVIPEPASLALVALGSLCLASRRRVQA